MMKKSLVKERSNLTKAENKICDYIEEYMNNSIYMTVTEIASNCGVGEATVTRFCRKLGFNSFLEFKMTMAQELKSNPYSSNDDGSDNKPIIKECYDNAIMNIQNSFAKIDYNQIELVTDLIINSNKILFAGIGDSSIIAENAFYKFMRLGFNCSYVNDSHSIMMMISLMTVNDALILVSHGGNTNEIIKAVELAKEKGIRVVAITEKLMSKLARQSDYIINYVSKDAEYKGATIQSTLPQNFIIELIYMNVINRNIEIYESNRKKTRKAIQILNR
ncbi:MurR/RpiR family transcriptional regulator [Clostridium paraputrificum]|uniref:MurR/RpiR family transcriptional regulator n=1 Tax=Clostridium paraputrificum TaxID=29363 RepID=UPI00325C33C3